MVRLRLLAKIGGALLLMGIAASSISAAEQPIVFTIQFEWGETSQEGYSYKGTAKAHFSLASQWTGRFGANMQAVTGKGFDETSPASLYQGLGSLAAMREGDQLQFYRARYTAKVTTDNGCSLADTQADSPEVNSAWINRTPDGAVLEFGTLEAADSEARCDHYNTAFTRDFVPGQEQALKEFFTFRLTKDDLVHFKSIHKVNTCTLNADVPTPGKIWGKATLTAE